MSEPQPTNQVVCWKCKSSKIDIVTTQGFVLVGGCIEVSGRIKSRDFRCLTCGNLWALSENERANVRDWI